MRFSPLDPEMFRMQAGIALAHLLAGRFDAASSWAEKSFRDLPTFLLAVAIIAASHALAGRQPEAQRAMQHLRKLDPALRVSNLEFCRFRCAEQITSRGSLTASGKPDCRTDREFGLCCIEVRLWHTSPVRGAASAFGGRTDRLP